MKNEKTVVERLRDIDCEFSHEFDCELFAAVNRTKDCGGLNCRECRKRTCKALADLMEGATPSKSTGLPKGIEWPRFEDGEFVWFGDEYVNDEGNIAPVQSVMFRAEGYRINKGMSRNVRKAYGEPVKCPEPDVLDADGVPILIGDTVYGEDGKAWTVQGYNWGKKHSVWANDGKTRRDLCPEWLTHRKPDTQEAIDADAAKEPCVYFNGTYLDKCDKCKLHDNDVDFDFDVRFNECRTAMNRDLLTRQRKLLGGE